MRIPRIFTEQPLRVGETPTLDQDASHYAATVLRLDPGAPVVLFNGDGNDYTGRLIKAGKKQIQVLVEAVTCPDTESPLVTHLGLGISRGDRMDWAVQKSTELGVSVITPLYTRRCEVKLKGKRESKRLTHWRQVAVSACEQSGRVRLPELRPPASLEDWLARVDSPVRLLFDHKQPQALAANPAPAEVALLIGPEGGLSVDEMDAARDAGFAGIGLGGRVLRTETAPVAALAILQFLWGDAGGD